MALTHQHCTPCQGGVPTATAAQIATRLPQVPGWRVTQVDGIDHLVRSFSFPDFARALTFVNQVGAVADVEGHHPDVRLSWGSVTLELWTHAIGGLHENDFILAAKVNALK